VTLNRREFLGLLGAVAQSAPAAPVSPAEARTALAGTKLIIVPYAHNDFGWLRSNLWDRERTPLVHKEALEIMRRDPDFKWFLDSEFEVLDWFLDRYPDMEQELKYRVKQGRFGVAPGSFCNPDNPFMEAEAMIRNLVLGRRHFEGKFPGVNLEAAVFADIHPGYAQIPQLLRQAGYRYYRITRPIRALDAKGYKREFVWEGLDGSDILFSYGLYSGGVSDYGAINNCRRDWDKALVTFYDSMKEALPGSATGVIWVPFGGDASRPLRAGDHEEIEVDLGGFVREWQKREPVPLTFGTPIEYFRELDQRRSRLPRLKGSVDPVGWPFWYGSCGSHSLDNWRERTTRDLVEAEILSCVGNLEGMPFPASQIDGLWRDALTLHFHDGLFVGDEDFVALRSSARDVGLQCDRIRTGVLKKLSRRIAAKPGTQAIAVFNPMSWSRRELVVIHPVFPSDVTARVRVLDSEGREIPHQTLKTVTGGYGGPLRYAEAYLLVEVEVPPLGYATLYIDPQKGEEVEDRKEPPVNVLENEYARLRLGETGIESLEDMRRGVRYPGAGNPVYYSTEDSWPYHGGPITGEARIAGASWRLVEQGRLRNTAETKGRLGEHQVALRLSLYHTVERIDLDLDLESAGGNGYFAIRVPFDFTGNVTTGIPFGAEILDLSREPFGKDAGEERLRENVFFAHHWVDYSDGRAGLALVAAEGKRGFRFDPHERFLEHILLMTIAQHDSPANATMSEWTSLFANRYFSGKGKHSFHYSLIPHGGDWRSAGVLQRAQEQLYPVRWIHVHSAAGASLPPRKSFVSIDPETIAISSWQWKPDGYQLRLYDTKGEGGDVKVRLPLRARRCEPVDFNGRPQSDLKVDLRQDIARFRMHPWQIVTLRIS
jgi:alpha-mannosidase